MLINFRLLIGNEDTLDLENYPYCEDYYELCMTREMDFCPQIGWTFILFPSDPDDSSVAMLAGVRMNYGKNPPLFDLVIPSATLDELKNEIIKEGWTPAYEYPNW